MGYLTNVIRQMESKTVIYWGTAFRIQEFIESNCLARSRLPLPHYVCPSDGEALKGFHKIPTISISEVINDLPAESTIILAGGFSNVEQQVLQHRLYYYPVYYFKSFEAFFHITDHPGRFREALASLADDRSKQIYQKCLDGVIKGSLWNQELYEPQPYFGNDLIGKIECGRVVLGGAFDGAHIDRLLRQSSSEVSIDAFEPSTVWSDVLQNRYRENANVTIHRALLWDSVGSLPFHYDIEGSGLSSRVASATQSSENVQSRTIDSMMFDDLYLLALDVEGAEQNVLRGAASTIERSLPNLAVCLYHSMEDYIDIPTLVQNLGKGRYRIYVKQHSCICAIETVLYAVKE